MATLFVVWHGKEYEIGDSLKLAEVMKIEDITGKSIDEMSSTRIAVGTIAIAVHRGGGGTVQAIWDELIEMSAEDLPQPQQRGAAPEPEEMIPDPTDAVTSTALSA